MKGQITGFTIDGVKFPAAFFVGEDEGEIGAKTNAERIDSASEYIKYLSALKPRALASFPEVATAALLKPIDWNRLTEKKEWPLFEYKTKSFDFFLGGDFAHFDTKSAAELRADVAKSMSAFISELSPPKAEPPPVAPSDAVPIAAGVSLRPLKYELDRVEVLKKGSIEPYWGMPRHESEVRVHFTTADRLDGKELKLYYRQSLKDELLEDPAYLPAMIRQTMRAAYMHEVDEMLYLDGARFTEPHMENAWNTSGPALLRAREDQQQHRAEIARIEGKT